MTTSAAASRAKVAALGATKKNPNKATRVARKIGLREMEKRPFLTSQYTVVFNVAIRNASTCGAP
jgi:hypothetical protein